MGDYQDRLFEETFDTVCLDLRRRRETDPCFTRTQLQGVLDGLYVSHGNNMEGRGEIRDIINEATIAACELVLSEWEGQIKRKARTPMSLS